jgi:hypothetical protein
MAIEEEGAIIATAEGNDYPREERLHPPARTYL